MFFGNNLDSGSFINHAYTASVKSTVYELEKYSIPTRIAEQLVFTARDNTELFHYVDDYTRDLVLQLVLNTYVHDSVEEIKVHKTWWDMFKDAHFPMWAKKRFPVKYTIKTINKKCFLLGHEYVYPRKTIVHRELESLPSQFRN